MPWKWLESARREMAREKAMRSRWEDGVREAARQMSRMRSGFFSDLRRARAARDFCLEVKLIIYLLHAYQSTYSRKSIWFTLCEEILDRHDINSCKHITLMYTSSKPVCYARAN